MEGLWLLIKWFWMVRWFGLMIYILVVDRRVIGKWHTVTMLGWLVVAMVLLVVWLNVRLQRWHLDHLVGFLHIRLRLDGWSEVGFLVMIRRFRRLVFWFGMVRFWMIRLGVVWFWIISWLWVIRFWFI